MTTTDQNVILALAASTVFTFILALAGADIGAPEESIIRSLCAVAVLGSMTFTAFITARRV